MSHSRDRVKRIVHGVNNWLNGLPMERDINRVTLIDGNVAPTTEDDAKDKKGGKFKLKTTQYLLAYRKVGGDFELVIIGPHENYYRDLKQYLKNR